MSNRHEMVLVEWRKEWNAWKVTCACGFQSGAILALDDCMKEYRKHCHPGLDKDAAKLHAAIADAEKIAPLPRCPHGRALRDGAGEALRPSCGCKL